MSNHTDDKMQSVTQSGDKAHFGIYDWRWFNRDNRPSWQRFGRGTAELRVDSGQSSGDGRWLAFDITETGEKSSRNVMVTLDEKSARSLLAFLNDKFK